MMADDLQEGLLDAPPAGWFISAVMRAEKRKWDWVMLMVDSPPDRSFSPWHRQCWVRIPGKHQSYDTAFDVAESMIATKH